MLGEQGGLEQRLLADLVAAKDRPRVAQLLLRDDGMGSTQTLEFALRSARGDLEVEAACTNLLDHQDIRGIVFNIRDISERKQLELELRDQAIHDQLTGLPNRTLLNDRLEHAFAVQQRDRNHHDLAVVFIDLDEFKSINDGLGHAAGDELLRAVARRLESAVRDADTVARSGGDEFALVLDSTFSAADTDDTADRILDVFKRPFLLAGEEHIIGASVGIAVSNGETVNAATLLQEADIAMHAAKLSGKDRRETYKPGMHQEVIDRLQLEADLRHAVDRNELAVVYQPLVDLASGALSGVEALMRWQHPTRGLLAPGSFIPAAERSGLIIPMGRWLLRQACSDLRDWDRLAHTPPLRLNANLSARQLDDPGLFADVAAALARSQLDPARLTLEITETILVDDLDSVITVLDKLKALGVELSIDDFGTGYSSLSYLGRLPVDEIKVDQSFIAAMTESEEAANLVRSVIRLAHDLHLRTIAEGVETQQQLDQLHQTDCELVQGYLFDPPLSEQQLSHRLQNGPPSWACALSQHNAAQPVGGSIRPARPSAAQEDEKLAIIRRTRADITRSPAAAKRADGAHK